MAAAYYNNLHNQIIINNLTTKIGNKKQQKSPTIVLFVLDSISNSNWIRNLPKTLKVLKQNYNSYIFDGFAKVGDNSFPNALAFLTGKTKKYIFSKFYS